MKQTAPMAPPLPPVTPINLLNILNGKVSHMIQAQPPSNDHQNAKDTEYLVASPDLPAAESQENKKAHPIPEHLPTQCQPKRKVDLREQAYAKLISPGTLPQGSSCHSLQHRSSFRKPPPPTKAPLAKDPRSKLLMPQTSKLLLMLRTPTYSTDHQYQRPPLKDRPAALLDRMGPDDEELELRTQPDAQSNAKPDAPPDTQLAAKDLPDAESDGEPNVKPQDQPDAQDQLFGNPDTLNEKEQLDETLNEHTPNENILNGTKDNESPEAPHSTCEA